MANEILTNLWLGNIIDSRNTDFLNNIDIVINCSKNIPFSNKKNHQIRIKVDDNLEKNEIVNMYKYLDAITEYIHKSLINSKRIFVHCYAGKQRSATVICAYIMKYLDLSYNDATELIRNKRLIIFTPLPNFDGALKLFEMKLKEKSNI